MILQLPDGYDIVDKSTLLQDIAYADGSLHLRVLFVEAAADSGVERDQVEDEQILAEGRVKRVKLSA